MTNTAADGTVRVAEKEKVEKRRALGRGLESLLPGPRVVGGAGVRPAGTPVGPRVPAPPALARNDHGVGVPFDGTIQAVVGGAEAAELRSAGQPGAAVPT